MAVGLVECAAVLRGYTVRPTFSGQAIAQVSCVRLSHWCASRTGTGMHGRQSAASRGDVPPDRTSVPFPAPGVPSPGGGVAPTAPSAAPSAPQSSSRSGPAWPPLPAGHPPCLHTAVPRGQGQPCPSSCGRQPILGPRRDKSLVNTSPANQPLQVS